MNKLRYFALLGVLSVVFATGLAVPKAGAATSPLACGNLLNDCVENGETDEVCYREYDECVSNK